MAGRKSPTTYWYPALKNSRMRFLPVELVLESSDRASVKPAKTELSMEDKRLIINLQGKSEIRIKY